MSTTGNPLTSNAEASYQRELTRANLLQEQLDEARKLIPRAPTETETVCGVCGGCGWVERGY
mgnify:FL=1